MHDPIAHKGKAKALFTQGDDVVPTLRTAANIHTSLLDRFAQLQDVNSSIREARATSEN